MGMWLKRLSIVAILGFPAAVAGYRLGLFHFGVSFKMLTFTMILSLVVFFIAVVVSLMHRGTKPESAKAAGVAVVLSFIPMVVLGMQAFKGKSLPEIHNISTDVQNPPEFYEVVALRGEGLNPLEYKASVLSGLQLKAYPKVRTLVTNDSAEIAFSKSLDVVKSLAWEVVNEDAAMGIIEATETTALWGFKDDVVVRIVSKNGQSHIDLRSVSRIGRSDLGANAKRIESFLEAYE